MILKGFELSKCGTGGDMQFNGSTVWYCDVIRNVIWSLFLVLGTIASKTLGISERGVRGTLLLFIISPPATIPEFVLKK